MKKTAFLFFVLILLFLNQSIALEKELKSPSSIALDREENIYILGGQNIYKYNQEGEFLDILNEKINDIGSVENTKMGTTSVLVRLYVDGKKTGAAVKPEQKDVVGFARYFRAKSTLENVIQKVVYPEQITIGLNRNIYIVGQDIFRKSYKLGILDPNDGHPITVFPAADEEVLKTRAVRLKDVINKKKFEKREELLEYISKNKGIINYFATDLYLEAILKYVPYDESHGENRWSEFRGKIVREWHKGEVVTPQGLGVDSEGRFYVTDYWDNKVKAYSNKGKFLFSFGGFGSKDGQFKAIRAIAIDDKNGFVYVTDNYFPSMFRGNYFDPYQMRVQKFTKDGKFVSKWGKNDFKGVKVFWPPRAIYEPELDEPDGIAVDSKGDVFVLCSYTGEVKKFAPEGKLIMQWGKNGTGEGEFRDPQAIVIDSEDNVYVADTDNDRVQKFDSDGKFLMEIK